MDQLVEIMCVELLGVLVLFVRVFVGIITAILNRPPSDDSFNKPSDKEVD
jgi:hypothetical protein